MRLLAIFDLDGTLARTTEVDGVCFVRAVHETLGLAVDANWETYENCTDQGILEEIVHRSRGRPPRPAEVDLVRSRFVELLKSRACARPDEFQEVAGARRILGELERRGWQTAIATGGWVESADLKRRTAGLPEAIPLFGSDTEPRRAGILLRALDHHVAQTGRAPRRVVSLGDGVWDVRTARELRIPFVGLSRGRRADRLRAEGASFVLEDYEDRERVFAALGRAEVPSAGHGPGHL